MLSRVLFCPGSDKIQKQGLKDQTRASGGAVSLTNRIVSSWTCQLLEDGAASCRVAPARTLAGGRLEEEAWVVEEADLTGSPKAPWRWWDWWERSEGGRGLGPQASALRKALVGKGPL